MEKPKIKKTFSIISISVIIFSYIISSGVLLLKPQRAIAATYTVTNNADSGAGSLRQAITDANSNPGADVIVFSAAMTIQPLTELPTIFDPVAINGYTGSPGGATANSAVSPAPFNGTLTVELDGQLAGTSSGIRFSTGSDGSSIRGIVINRFTNDGIYVGAPNVTIAGNYIGTDTTGLVDQGNTLRGIGNSDNGAGDGLTIGGLNAEDRNIISGNNEGGASPNTGDDNWTIQGNYIGLGATGVTAIPNAQVAGSGALSLDNSNGHVVGGSTNAAKNVISGNNSHGIAPHNSDNLTIAGNYIGTTYTGATALANGGSGITVGESVNVQIGGTTGVTAGGNCTGECNIISNNGVDGIFLGQDVTTTTIEGNYIGTDITGAVDFGNTNFGVSLGAGASTNTIGGSSAEARNVISGNTLDGVTLFQAGAGNTVVGNYIGTNAAGTADLGNNGNGVQLSQTDSTTIGGNTSGARNIISGNNSSGVYISDSDTNTILGNYIGTNAAGDADLGNAFSGVALGDDAANNTIGGTTSGARNIISGNNSSGISTDGDGTPAGTGNTIQGNYVGLAVDGATDLGNAGTGIGLYDASGTIVGGLDTGARNVVSGNDSEGITVLNISLLAASNNQILGNYVGTDYTGTLAVLNNSTGIRIEPGTGTGNIVGGTTTGARNVVSGNGGIGISAEGNTTVQGNYVGLKADGSGVLPNTTAIPTSPGLRAIDSGNIIGGTTSGAGNIVSGNATFGIVVMGLSPFGGASSFNNTVQGNCVGTNANCEYEAGFGNTQAGIAVLADAFITQIGGTTEGAGNTVVGNGSGIAVIGIATFYPLGASILGNSIYNNSGATFPNASIAKGIDLLQTSDFVTSINIGVTPNDANDIDYDGTNTGPNHYLNFPVINSITSTDGQVTINYDLDINDAEAGATGYRVEFFANDAADPSGYGEGQTFLGFENVAGDVTGQSVTFTLPAGVEGNKFISATTTMTDASNDGFGHTSEFGALVEGTLIPTGSVTPTPATLAPTGKPAIALIALSTLLLLTGGAGFLVVRRRYHPKEWRPKL